MKRSAQLTSDYAKRFRTETILHYVTAGIITKDINYYYTGGRVYAYTLINPKTLKLDEEEESE